MQKPARVDNAGRAALRGIAATISGHRITGPGRCGAFEETIVVFTRNGVQPNRRYDDDPPALQLSQHTRCAVADGSDTSSRDYIPVFGYEHGRDADGESRVERA